MIIEARDIRKSFGTLEVLKGIDFSAEAHEIVSIMGASGAGKSTLLQILGTLSRPDGGSLRIDGEFTAEENVLIPALIAGVPMKEARRKAVRLLGEVGLQARLDHKPSELSGGEQQRVAIARALVNDPAVLFADEPTGNLDSATKQEIHKLLFDLRDRLGQTIVIVTHDPELAALCDRTLTMKDGRFI